MANRLYLYSIDKKPKKGEKVLVKDAYEWSSYIPLVPMALMSGNPETCMSLIWDEKEAILSDYDEGMVRLEKLIRLLIDNNMQHKEVFMSEAKKTFQYFSKPQLKQKYFLLEPSEVFELYDGTIKGLMGNIEYVAECIDNKDFEGLNEFVGTSDLRTEWERLVDFAENNELPNVLWCSSNNESIEVE